MIGGKVPIQRELVEQRGLIDPALSHHRTDPPALKDQSESAHRRPGNSRLLQHDRRMADIRRAHSWRFLDFRRARRWDTGQHHYAAPR